MYDVITGGHITTELYARMLNDPYGPGTVVSVGTQSATPVAPVTNLFTWQNAVIALVLYKVLSK